VKHPRASWLSYAADALLISLIGFLLVMFWGGWLP
jgi:hypothetical protein